jgi:radical SAM/Cys-rich protein
MGNLSLLKSPNHAHNFDERVSEQGEPGLFSASRLLTVQVNIGLKCNLICTHCHVNSSPRRTEEMDWATMAAVIEVAEKAGVESVDITGGAPEMNQNFQRFVEALRARGLKVMARTNLTILLEDGYEEFPAFFRKHNVELVASLPCYTEENVDGQRGGGVFGGSIESIRRLNAVGYGIESGLALDLVFNPGGPSLPPAQAELEEDYRRELRDGFGIEFTRLHTITNIPIGRFKGDLRKRRALDAYMDLLRQNFNPETVEHLMCRHQISVGWDGSMYDCDYNLALRLPAGTRAENIRDIDVEALTGRRIVTGAHCYACTAGAGSSCGGALV